MIWPKAILVDPFELGVTLTGRNIYEIQWGTTYLHHSLDFHFRSLLTSLWQAAVWPKCGPFNPWEYVIVASKLVNSHFDSNSSSFPLTSPRLFSKDQLNNLLSRLLWLLLLLCEISSEL